jgi:hypothetical protein
VGVIGSNPFGSTILLSLKMLDADTRNVRWCVLTNRTVSDSAKVLFLLLVELEKTERDGYHQAMDGPGIVGSSFKRLGEMLDKDARSISRAMDELVALGLINIWKRKHANPRSETLDSIYEIPALRTNEKVLYSQAG